MAFKLVYYSQQDPQWKADILGFGEASDTLGYVGCALTSVSMLLSGHGFTESPKSLNQKLKGINGFAGAGIRWGAVSQLYPKVSVKTMVSCATSDAPLGQIDAALAAGQPMVVMVDSTPAPGLLTHWVVLYARKGDDYLMLDPWPYQPDVTKETLLMPRYSQGNPLKRSIMHVIFYESSGASAPAGTVSTPASTGTQTSSGTPASHAPAGPQPGGVVPPVRHPAGMTPAGQARVKADVTWGLNVRTSEDTSSLANVVATVPAGTSLSLLDADGPAHIGAVNQWLRVRAPNGKEGLAAAWYLEKVPGAAPATQPAPASQPTTGSQPPTSAAEPADPTARLKVVVSSSAGAKGLKIYGRANTKGKVVSTQPAGAVLASLETPEATRAKIGQKGAWINVRYATGKKGFVQAEYVELAR